MRHDSLWSAVWPWAVLGSTAVFGSRALQDYRAGGPDARVDGLVAVVSVLALVAFSVWGFRGIIAHSRDKRSTLFQVLCFAIAMPALAWSNPNTHTRVMVGIATLMVAFAKLAQAREHDRQSS